ncbi:hypothetical protein [Saccharopolyspora hattusasensis]|uniref:hypothetical protein n=1 Tax=Saccharopolyspora hattusasensis TaxID=1128679 RepID=UPI003D9581D3
MSNDPSKPATATGELTKAIADSLISDAPSDWAELRMTFRGSSTICQVELSGSRAGGAQLLLAPPRALPLLLRKLRADMYQPDFGTWLSVQATVQRNSEPNFQFNYTDDPQWSPPVAPTVFALDQQAFPRSPKYIPSWLNERLTDAATFAERYRYGASDPSTG